MDEHGFCQNALQAIRNQEYQHSTPLPLTSMLEDMVKEQSVIKLQDVYVAVARAAQSHGHSRDDIEQTVMQLLASEHLVQLGHDSANNMLFSTPAMIAMEKELFTQAQQLQQQSNFNISQQQVQDAIKTLEILNGFPLSDEQALAVYQVCKTGLDVLQGAAGAGKSTSMQAIRLAYKEAGFQVKGTCIAKVAANQLQEETGIPSQTLAKLFDEIERGQANLKNTVLVLDEAGQISSKDLHRLTQALQKDGGKLILVGEDKQLNAITHGGSLRFLSEKLGTAKVETIRRQKESWARKAVQQFRVGDALPALQKHDEHGLVHWGDKQTDCITELVNQWHNHQQKEPKKQALMLANNWEQVNQLSNRARMLHQAEGKVGNENIQMNCWVADRAMQFEYSTGDRVKLTKNDYRLGLTNGTLGTITKIEPLNNGHHQITLKGDNGKKHSIRTDEYCNENGQCYMALGYAMTIYSSQGSTVNGDTFVLYSEQMDRASCYVAGSRHKDRCHWFVNRNAIDLMNEHNSDQERIETLAEMMAQDRQPQLTLDYLHEKEQQEELGIS